jgi:hypothetical protein
VSIERADFDSIVEQDLRELVDGQVPEGLRIDYKLTLYSTSDADKRELLKDISAFANSQGGHIVLGVEENAGVATRLAGITGLNPDAEMLRMEQVARTGLDPRISGLRFKAGDDGTHRYLIHDRDGIFARHFDNSVLALGLKVLRTPFRSPKANSICERVIGTIRRECLDWMIPVSEGHLRATLRE